MVLHANGDGVIMILILIVRQRIHGTHRTHGIRHGKRLVLRAQVSVARRCSDHSIRVGQATEEPRAIKN